MSSIITKKSKKVVSKEVIEARVKRAFDVIGKEIYLPSQFIAKELLGVEHKNLLRKIKKEYEKLQHLAAQPRATKYFKESTYQSRGKTETNYLLSEQAVMMIMMSYNNETATMYRYLLTELFYAMKETIIRNRLKVELNASNPDWLPHRIEEKHARLTLTDAIHKHIIPQRMKEGKVSDGWQFKHYTNLIYSILGIEVGKCVNVKDTLTPKQLQGLEKLEDKVTNLIEVYTEEGLHYKEVYKKIKEKLTV
jgi:phage regulator Rha-like protein